MCSCGKYPMRHCVTRWAYCGRQAATVSIEWRKRLGVGKSSSEGRKSMTCRPLTKEEADDLRAKYWPTERAQLIDALTREPGESLLEWEARAKAVRQSLRSSEGKPDAQ